MLLLSPPFCLVVCFLFLRAGLLSTLEDGTLDVCRVGPSTEELLVVVDDIGNIIEGELMVAVEKGSVARTDDEVLVVVDSSIVTANDKELLVAAEG